MRKGASGRLFALCGGRASSFWSEVDSSGRLRILVAPNGMAPDNRTVFACASDVADGKGHVLTLSLRVAEDERGIVVAAVDGKPFRLVEPCAEWRPFALPGGKLQLAPDKDGAMVRGAIRRLRLDVAPY